MCLNKITCFEWFSWWNQKNNSLTSHIKQSSMLTAAILLSGCLGSKTFNIGEYKKEPVEFLATYGEEQAAKNPQVIFHSWWQKKITTLEWWYEIVNKWDEEKQWISFHLAFLNPETWKVDSPKIAISYMVNLSEDYLVKTKLTWICSEYCPKENTDTKMLWYSVHPIIRNGRLELVARLSNGNSMVEHVILYNGATYLQENTDYEITLSLDSETQKIEMYLNNKSIYSQSYTDDVLSNKPYSVGYSIQAFQPVTWSASTSKLKYFIPNSL